jgi:hypothetical protein
VRTVLDEANIIPSGPYCFRSGVDITVMCARRFYDQEAFKLQDLIGGWVTYVLGVAPRSDGYRHKKNASGDADGR